MKCKYCNTKYKPNQERCINCGAFVQDLSKTEQLALPKEPEHEIRATILNPLALPPNEVPEYRIHKRISKAKETAIAVFLFFVVFSMIAAIIIFITQNSVNYNSGHSVTRINSVQSETEGNYTHTIKITIHMTNTESTRYISEFNYKLKVFYKDVLLFDDEVTFINVAPTERRERTWTIDFTDSDPFNAFQYMKTEKSIAKPKLANGPVKS